MAKGQLRKNKEVKKPKKEKAVAAKTVSVSVGNSAKK